MNLYKALGSSVLRHGLQNASRMQVAGVHGATRIGNRDWVGYGINGSANYEDRSDMPFPAIRFGENTPDVLVSILISKTLLPTYVQAMLVQHSFYNTLVALPTLGEITQVFGNFFKVI